MLKRIIGVILTAILLITMLPLSLYAQVKEPDTFTISSVEVYQNTLELGDILFLIIGTIDYTVPPTQPVNETYVVRLMDAGGVEVGATTFYPYKDNGYDYGISSIYFSASEVTSIPITWGAEYSIRIDGSPTIHWLDTTAVTAMHGAESFEAGVGWFDFTAQANSAAASDFNIDLLTGSSFYFISDSMFNLLTVNIGTNGSWTGTYIWEYWDGVVWKDLQGLTDGTLGFEAGVGVRDVNFTCPTDWQTTTINTVIGYAIRFRIVLETAAAAVPLGTQSWTNSLTTAPSINSAAITWHTSTTIVEARTNMTVRMRIIAKAFESIWGVAYDLIEVIASSNKLTADGEEYFTNSIQNLRIICPELFADSLTTPDFTENILIDDKYISSTNTNSAIYGTNWFAQTFTPTDTYTITGFEFKNYRIGNPANITASIWTTAAGVPVAIVAGITGTESGSGYTLNTLGNWEQINFGTSYQVNAGTTYAFVISAAAGGLGNQLNWLADSAGTYTGGQSCVSVNSGGAWAAVAGQDFQFIIVADNAYNQGFRNKMANLLVGTPLDFTNNFLGMSRMWFGALVWICFCMALAIVMFIKTQEMKAASITFLCLFPLGVFGFIYLEIAALEIFIAIALPLWIHFYQRGG